MFLERREMAYWEQMDYLACQHLTIWATLSRYYNCEYSFSFSIENKRHALEIYFSVQVINHKELQYLT